MEDIRVIEKPRLYNWYIGKRTSHTGEVYDVVKGNVWGNEKFIDSDWMTSSRIRNIEYDYDQQMCIVTTLNTVYYCPMEYCNVVKQEVDYPGGIGDDDIVKILDIVNSRVEPSIDDGNILITLSTFERHYFHGVYYRKPGDKKPVEFETYPHIGTYQDSFLITSWDNDLDFRYFPYPYAISFYSYSDAGVPVYLENIGFDAIDAETHCGMIHLGPGERKLVDKANAESEPRKILRSDLYPAMSL